MPLQKFQMQPGVNRESTRSSTNQWYTTDKVRFRKGFPERIGGWTRISASVFLGICRSIWVWVSLGGKAYTGIGTHLKYYIENGGKYYDVTPIRATVALTDPFDTTSGSAVVTVTDAAGGYVDGDYVTFSSATAVGGITLDGQYEISYSSGNTYTVTHSSVATGTASGGGSVSAAYQINIGPATASPLVGWGAGTWGAGTWGVGGTNLETMRVWSNGNFGEDLILAPINGAIYCWDASGDVNTRAVLLSSLAGAASVPVIQSYVLVSDYNRFVFALGCNEFGSSAQNQLHVRWSDQEDASNWAPAATNQSGGRTLSRGTKIVTGLQARQELLVWTDSSLYAFQYVGAPIVWSSQLVGDNISIVSPRAVAYSNGKSFWMGKGKFYVYTGTVDTLPCALREYVFSDFNSLQNDQCFAGTHESFSEIWWFYCSASSETVDRYVVYNYESDVWYYGTMGRTAWYDSGLKEYPLAATYTLNLVHQGEGIDDNETGTTAAITATLESSEFDMEDGERFSMITRVLPDITFNGSTAENPTVDLTLTPLTDSGSGYNSPASVGGNDSGSIVRSATSPVEAYTSQLNIRVRGRQIVLKIDSSALGTCWRLGVPRLDTRPSGRRG